MQKITQAVILAGGSGTRLKPFTLNNPKPMVPINGKPFLEYLINLLKLNNIEEIIILSGYLSEKIEKYFGNGTKLKIKIKYSYTPYLNEKGEENKSGIRIKNAEELLNDKFLLLYCDNYWPLNLNKLINFYSKYPSDMLITVYTNKDNSTKNNVLVKDGYVIKYDRTRKEKKLNGVDIGFFIIDKKVIDYLPTANSQFEEIILPKLVKQGKLSAYLTDNKYYSIGDPKRVKITEKFLKPKKIIFLDRDGTINEKAPKAHYITKWAEFKFLPGALDAIQLLTKKGYKIFIISNQAGIARGILTKKQLDSIHRNMIKEIKKNGGEIEHIYICPHNWDGTCDCRKPKPGLLIQASNNNLIDLSKAIFIGDDIRDKEAGEAVSCKTILVTKKNNLLKIVKSLD